MAQKEEEEDHPFPFMQEQQEQSGERNSVSSSSSRNLQQLKLGWVNRHQSNVRHLQFLMPYGIRYNEINHTHQPSFSQVQMASSSSSSSITQDSSEVENLASRMESLTFSNLNAFHGYHEPCLQCVRNIHSANATLPTRHHHHHHHHHRRLHAIGVWLSMAKDPRGSRVVQQKIDEGTRQENFHIVKELEHHFHELIKHPYGSFVILKLFQSRNITVAQKNYFIYLITTDLSMLRDLCIHDLGGRVIQQILEIEDVLIAIDQITYAMSRVTVALMKNNNGGYVILQCLKVILEVVARNCYDIAVNKSGCCSIQKVIQHDDVPGFYALIDNLISNAENLAKDQYGFVSSYSFS
ncbi:pumilio homolog 11-like [Vigna unguiculata]|uniref:pumilio homolog 11-like n=1 Tax=Vigna unguiculata TaxID=3917 RepID=UPI0010160003|nr:pumilio homolog 11-like [Vigna unguiculata]